jgi:rhodanese-related sulfurtransferase
MKSKILFLVSACFVCFTAQAQLNQRFDNINYKALYFKDAAKLMAKNPNLLLLDVRSPGEYADTSSTLSLNIGRLNGSVNISIDSIRNHLKDLEPYKNKEILVYCSHSQRSRVVGKLLNDNGFTKVNSLNGGMSLVNKSTGAEFPLKSSLYTNNLPYKLIQSEDAYQFIRDRKNVIIDLRPASQYNGTDSQEGNNIGRIKTAINIPADQFDSRISGLAKYKDKPILLYDLQNSESTKAALKLKKAGFKNVNVLFEGLTTLLINTPSNSNLRGELFINYPKYKVIGSKETIQIADKTPGLIVADVRPQEQFENKSDKPFLNLGHIKNAINTPTEQQLYTSLEGKPKSSPIMVYGNYASNLAATNGLPPVIDAPAVCKHLSEMGYTNVNLVYSGLYSVVWSVTNVEGCKDGMSILTDHKGLY